MRITFLLGWLSGKDVSSGKWFKSKEAGLLFQEYLSRISVFSKSEVSNFSTKGKASVKIWVCERQSNSRPYSSEEISRELGKVLGSSCRELQIVIGGPNGISKTDLENLKPDLWWSFGALTLPHELAAVIAGEQVYRAWTILKNLPYHLKH